MRALLKSGMMGSVLALSIGVYAGGVTPLSENVQWRTVIWQHIPINIALPVGQERIIRVPHSAEIGLPETIAADVESQRFGGWFYLTAQKAFTSVPIEIRDNVTGQTVLINLSASHHASDSAVNIVYPKTLSTDQLSVTRSPFTVPVGLQGSMGFETLTQYAEQQLYAPKRLLSNPDHIELVKSFVNQQGEVPKDRWVYHLLMDGSVIGEPWAEWASGHQYVTAVLIHNQLPVRIDLVKSLVNLCGRVEGTFQAVTFFPSKPGAPWELAPRGQPFDTTVAFLVSQKPFHQAIDQCEG